MASTTSLPDPVFTKPITSMTIAELRQTCVFFGLPNNGITPTIRNRLRNFLAAHKQEIQHDYDYIALYPDRDPLPVANQPVNDPPGSHTFSQRDGIRGENPPPQTPPHHPANVAAGPTNRVEEYLQGKSSHSHSPLLSFLQTSRLPSFLHSLTGTPLALPNTAVTSPKRFLAQIEHFTLLAQIEHPTLLALY
jgi:hypothetical protein